MVPLKTRPCSREDINFDGKNEHAKFQKPSDEYIVDINRFYHKLLCIDEEFDLEGNFNMAKAKQLMMVFEVCRDPPGTEKPKCQDYEKVIKPWMNRKFLFTL